MLQDLQKPLGGRPGVVLDIKKESCIQTEQFDAVGMPQEDCSVGSLSLLD